MSINLRQKIRITTETIPLLSNTKPAATKAGDPRWISRIVKAHWGKEKTCYEFRPRMSDANDLINR